MITDMDRKYNLPITCNICVNVGLLKFQKTTFCRTKLH